MVAKNILRILIAFLNWDDRLVNVLRVEQLVNDYVKCWMSTRPTYSGQWEDNDFGCEHLQIFRNGFNLEDFNHDELSQLAVLLTRELRGQINRDHKFFWAWCAFSIVHFERDVTLFSDRDWAGSFKDLTNLVLSAKRRFPAGPAGLPYARTTLRYVNNHLLETALSKWQIGGPLVFSVLEGLLRLKNKDYVNKDGSVKRRFTISDPQRGTKNFDPRGRNKWLNRINESLRCFEELVSVNRGRTCPYLQQMKIEIASLCPPAGLDVYDMVDVWRNDLIHGKEYWQNRAPILANLICLLIVDEIEPSLYDAQKADMKRTIQRNSQSRALTGVRTPWDLFPPDI